MPIGFGKNGDDSSIQPLNNDDLQEIKMIHEMLNPNEEVLVVARQSRVRPGGSAVTPNIIYATNKRIIIRDPYMLGIKENIVDIPFDVITSVKLDKGLLSSTIRFEAPALVGSKRLGIVDGIVSGENDQEGLIEAIPKRKAEDIVQVIRSGMHEAGYNQNRIQTSSHQISGHSSITDELSKLGKLEEQGIITDEEFAKLKKDLLERKSTR
jgi:PH (Pleckstrin Homology) domain-containing protein